MFYNFQVTCQLLYDADFGFSGETRLPGKNRPLFAHGASGWAGAERERSSEEGHALSLGRGTFCYNGDALWLCCPVWKTATFGH